MERKFKRVLTIGDLHCGHRVGLTPPEYQSAIAGRKWHRIQVELWDYFAEQIESIKPIDILIINGDAIDGKGSRSGASELITADMKRQTEIAQAAIEFIGAETVCLTYGTPYHVGTEDDWEKVLADQIGASIGSHEWFDINNTVFDVKHHIGSSSIPHGKATPVAKDRLWNLIWTEFEEQPKADVILRSHVHYFNFCGEEHWLGMTLPALQGQGSKFGARRCSGVVHFGIVFFDCYDGGGYTWERRIIRAESQKREAVKL